MANFNRIILVGNLTRDPQLKYLPSQAAVAEFGLAVNHKYRTKDGQEREEVLFIDCSCFGRGGEVINQYCRKGSSILIEGRLKYDTWEDKQGGGKRSKHSVFVENFKFMGGSRDAAGGAPAASYEDQGSAPAPRGAARPPQARPQPAAPAQQPAPEPPFTQEQQFSEDDIPF